MNSMIWSLKIRSRSFFIKPERFIAKFLLRHFATCNLVAALESRTDICKAYYLLPDGKYDLIETRPYATGTAVSTIFTQDGPAVILALED